MPFIRFLVGLAALLIMLPAAASAAMTLQAHRAVYDLRSEAAAKRGSGVSVTGRLVLEVAATCDGHLVNQRMVTTSRNEEGDNRLHDFRAAIFEATDGNALRFTIQTLADGDMVEETDGRARLSSRGGTGSARYSQRDDKPLDLPAGTIFPVTHSERLLTMAQAGQRLSEDLLFDGSDTGLFRVTSFVGQPRPFDAALAKRFPGLADQRAWNVQLAYYPVANESEVPEFEMGFRMHANGIASDMMLDYGSMRLVGTLVDLTVLPAPDCG